MNINELIETYGNDNFLRIAVDAISEFGMMDNMAGCITERIYVECALRHAWFDGDVEEVYKKAQKFIADTNNKDDRFAFELFNFELFDIQ